MMLLDTDHGTRCDEHVGEAFRPRCGACDAEAAAEARSRTKALRIGECPQHPGYPASDRFPCDRCKRDELHHA